MNITKCAFLNMFHMDFSEAMTFTNAKKKTGPHVYLFIACNEVEYANGTSQIAYIGYTDSPKDRFKNHHRKERWDKVMMLSLTPFLRGVKDNFHDWRKSSTRERRRTAESMERVFLYLFKRIMGELPLRNTRRDLPRNHDVAVLAEFILESRSEKTKSKRKTEQRRVSKKRTSSSTRMKKRVDLSCGKKIATELLRRAASIDSTSRRTRDASGRRILKISGIHLLRVREYKKQCHVQIRCKRAFDGGRSRRNTSSSAWYYEWHSVENLRDINKVVRMFLDEWS